MLVMQRPTVEALGEEANNRQRFAVGPLEPGFGHTIGNSLRRTLLSSIPGAAITTVRFDDALHEFDTIAGVTEDVTDIILNIKDIVAHLRRPTRTSSSASTSAARPTITAGDIKCPADVEILNKDLAHRHAQRARAASPSTSPSSVAVATCRATATTRTAPSASSRSTRSSRPVRRVMFEVEPTRVEQSTNYDRLVIDIETDGSITPAEALASAGATLRSLVDLVAS